MKRGPFHTRRTLYHELNAKWVIIWKEPYVTPKETYIISHMKRGPHHTRRTLYHELNAQWVIIWTEPYETPKKTYFTCHMKRGLCNMKRALWNIKRDLYYKSYEKRPTSYTKNPISGTQCSLSRHMKRALWNTKKDLYHKSYEKSYDVGLFSCDIWYQMSYEITTFKIFCFFGTLVNDPLYRKANFSIGCPGNRELTKTIKYHKISFLYCELSTKYSVRGRITESWKYAKSPRFNEKSPISCERSPISTKRALLHLKRALHHTEKALYDTKKSPI